MKSTKVSSITTLATVVALIAGICIGLVAFESQSKAWLTAADNLSAVGTLWTNALRMTIIPLIVSTLVVAVAGSAAPLGVGRTSGITFLTFASLLIIGALLVLIVLPPVLTRWHLDTQHLPSSTNLSVGERPATESTEGSGSSFKDMIATLLPSNLIKAGADDDLLPIVLFSVLLGLAVTRIEAEQREIFVSVMAAISKSIGIVIRWILLLMPVGIFAYAFSATATVGWNTVGILGAWIAMVSALSMVLTAGLYPIASFVGGVPVGAFARASLAAQGVGLTTRSSLAALPAMLEGVRLHLCGHQTTASLVLPLSVSSFKINRSINGTARLLFLAHVYGISLGPVAILTFVAGNLLMSFSSPGLPAHGPSATLPLYLAVGIPLEGVVLLKSVDTLTDFAMTVLNVTGDMTAMTLVARFSRRIERPSSLPAEASQARGDI
ncbi:MAG: cation:dicarboxylase symporter family transporter [Acidobacteriota bacterium]